MKKNKFLFLFLMPLGVFSFALILWITPFGAGVSPDSLVYIAAAKSILSGTGYSIYGAPINHFPPLYSMFLAATSLFAKNLIQAARFLNAILFSVNVTLFSLAVYTTSGRKLMTTTLAILFFFSSASFIEIHSYAWSEPLFIAFSLACILLLSLYIVRQTLPLLITSSLALGLAMVTRYTGLAFLPAALVIVFAGQAGQKLGKRLRDTGIWLVLASMPIGLFVIRNLLQNGAMTDRDISSHILSLSSYISYVWTALFDFAFPISLKHKTIILGLIIVLLIVLLLIPHKRTNLAIRWRSMDVVMPISCFLFSISYLMFLWISISFMDASTPIDTRLLSPFFILLTLGFFSSLWVITQKFNKPIVWWSFLILVGCSIGIRSPQAITTAIHIQRDGLDITSRQWVNSESLAFVKSLNNGLKVYTNASDLISFWIDRQSFSLPIKTDLLTTAENRSYHEQVLAICNDVTDKKAILVYLDQYSWRTDLPSQEEIMATCRLPILRSFTDGTTVYGEK